MPFGVLKAMPVCREPKSPKLEDINSEYLARAKRAAQARQTGSGSLQVLITAPTALEASDYACALYFNLAELLTGTDVAVFTRDYQTIQALTSRKRELEALCSGPMGTEMVRRTPADGEDLLSAFTVTLGQSGNQELSLDLHITCAGTAAGAAGGGGADVVLALCRPGDTPRAGKAGTFTVADAFAERELHLEPSSQSQLQASVRNRIRNSFLSRETAGSAAAFACAQVYGGLVFRGRRDGVPVFSPTLQCRGWTPVGCHIPLLTALESRGSGETEPGIQALYGMIRQAFAAGEPYRDSWCEALKRGGDAG